MDIQGPWDFSPYWFFLYFNGSDDFTYSLTFNLTRNFTTTIPNLYSFPKFVNGTYIDTL